ncbi:hypothetical protein DAI22_02g304100 [Oryza sativa Japonica Group]|nr:hypothetical protein DAI22_02g304100 [Oryza sativa Japonica Group]
MAAPPATASAPSLRPSAASPRAAAARSVAVPSGPRTVGPRRDGGRFLGVRAAKAVSGVQSGTVVDDGVQRPWKLSDARLVLEDGSVWKAKSFGASGTQVGEVVFNTSLTGYQEILTDPSYAGQFVLMTNPHIGNTGVNPDDEESNRCFLAGLIIRNLSICTSNWRCTETLEEYLMKRNIMGIYDVDTRAVTRRLREDGSLIGVLSTDQSRTDDELLEMAKNWKIVGVDLISGVTCDAPYEWSDKTDSEWEFKKGQSTESFHVVAYDFGIKHNILRRLTSYGCKITVVPANWPASENHNYAVDPESLPEGVKVTHINLNDNSCAGLQYPKMKLLSLQYHPESSPGPHDSDLAFGEFIEMMKNNRL